MLNSIEEKKTKILKAFGRSKDITAERLRDEKTISLPHHTYQLSHNMQSRDTNRRISARNATRSKLGILIGAKKRQAKASATPRKIIVFGERINLPNPQG